MTGYDMNVSRDTYEKELAPPDAFDQAPRAVLEVGMNEAKEILRAIVKSPLFWASLVALGNAVQRWLAPNVPNEVVIAVNGFIGVVGTIVGGFYAGIGGRQELHALIAERGRDA